MITRKKLISFEGIDKSGKSTQALILKEKLGKIGKNVILTYEPGGVGNFESTRKILLEGDYKLDPLSELFIFIADRREHVKKVIIPGLEKNSFVITDRYIDSTIAYQGGGRGIDNNIIDYLNKIAVEEIIPSVTFLIDITVEESFKRKGENDKIDTGNSDFMNKVRNKYLEIAKNNERVVVIDGTKSVNEISDTIYDNIRKEFLNDN